MDKLGKDEHAEDCNLMSSDSHGDDYGNLKSEAKWSSFCFVLFEGFSYPEFSANVHNDILHELLTSLFLLRITPQDIIKSFEKKNIASFRSNKKSNVRFMGLN